jgi:hypothetical protein
MNKIQLTLSINRHEHEISVEAGRTLASGQMRPWRSRDEQEDLVLAAGDAGTGPGWRIGRPGLELRCRLRQAVQYPFDTEAFVQPGDLQFRGGEIPPLNSPRHITKAFRGNR